MQNLVLGRGVVSRVRFFGSALVSGWVQAGFGLKFVKVFGADFGPAYKFV